jgi:hypothetical protein
MNNGSVSASGIAKLAVSPVAAMRIITRNTRQVILPSDFKNLLAVRGMIVEPSIS